MPQKKPNILLITSDQQRYDSVGPLAPAWMRAPHFDHLRREGISFNSAYADCPVCVPSRVSIMTGQSVFTHKMAANGHTSYVMGHENTLPSRLGALGYQTAAIGKMHFTPQRMRHGFQEMVLPEDYYRWIRESGFPYQPMRHGLGQNELYSGMATVPESLTLTSWIAEQCVSYIRDRRDPTLPFFLWCSFPKPHPPLDPPEPYYSMYRGCDIAAAAYGDWCEGENCPPAFARGRHRHAADAVSPEIIREARAAYYGLITQNDYNMGRVFAALQDVNLFDETMVIFCSDHGEYLGDHRMASKKFFHEQSAHVPFVLRLPKSFDDRPCDITSNTPLTLADILPTCVVAAGGAPPTDVDGRDLAALARGEGEPRQYIEGALGGVGEHMEPAYLAITDGRWKYIWYPEGEFEQLFDNQNDTLDVNNLAGIPEYVAKVEELREAMIRRHRERNSTLLHDGKLPTRPVEEVNVREVHQRTWPGFVTDYAEVDTRH